MTAPQKKSNVNGILIVARNEKRVSQLKRILNHLGSPWTVSVHSFWEAEQVLLRQTPEVLLIDMTELTSGEYIRKVAPFILSLPGWIKTFLIEPEPTIETVIKASEAGVTGILKSATSHYGISSLVSHLSLNQPSFSSKERE